MTEQVITNLITAGAALTGAVVGALGTLVVTKRTVEANRKRENFQIRKSDYESRMQAVAGIRMFGHAYWLTGVITPGDVWDRTKKTAEAICSCIGGSPWLFDEAIRKSYYNLGVEMNDAEEARYELEALRQSENVDLTTINSCSERQRISSAQVLIRLQDIFMRANDELDKEVAEYRHFIENGLE